MNWNFSNKSPLVEQATFIHTAHLSAMTPVGVTLSLLACHVVLRLLHSVLAFIVGVLQVEYQVAIKTP